jgi:hypothetical protein
MDAILVWMVKKWLAVAAANVGFKFGTTKTPVFEKSSAPETHTASALW